MNVKKMIAAALLLVPAAALSLSVKPASAHDDFYRHYEEPRLNDHRVITQEPVYRFHHRRVWVPGHWDYDRHGERFWIPGHYEFRDSRNLREFRDIREFRDAR